ncbi:MAG: primase alpha helix C-terminal domain-containing protein [Enterococcus sp.]
MIYTGFANSSYLTEPIEKSFMQFFDEYEPQYIEVPGDKEKQSEIKRNAIRCFISGEMKVPVRKNKNMIQRDCLVLDLDDVVVTKEELVDCVTSQFEEIQFILYPTFSHCVKGVRYRFVLPLDAPIADHWVYSNVINFMNCHVFNRILGTPDKSNGTWSQLQALPVLTQYVSKEDMIVNKVDKLVPTRDLVAAAGVWQEGNSSVKRRKSFKQGGSKKRTSTTMLLESLVEGCEDGNRNNRIAQITGGLLARQVNVEMALELVKIANSYFNPPLAEAEVEATFISIAKKELGASD